MEEQSCVSDTCIGCRQHTTHWKQGCLKLPLYMLRNVRPHPGSQTLASDLSKTRKHIQNMFTHPLPGVGCPKAGRKQGHSCTQASQIKKPTRASNTSKGLWEHSCWLTPCHTNMRGRKVGTVQCLHTSDPSHPLVPE